MHPYCGRKEQALVASSDICKGVVLPLLTDEDNVMSPSLLLQVLLKSLTCGLISGDLQRDCIVDEEHILQLLFVLLEIYQETEQFWLDWSSNERCLMQSFILDKLCIIK